MILISPQPQPLHDTNPRASPSYHHNIPTLREEERRKQEKNVKRGKKEGEKGEKREKREEREERRVLY